MGTPSLKRDQLAGFHCTISQQLNARLAESPRFFWALVVVSTGYGYVLWNVAKNPEQTEPGSFTVFVIASLLSYATILWASWYLAALGYAFRFLQNGQHRIEYALGWNTYVPNGNTGKPPVKIRRCGHIFWLLPGIYHAHAFGLVALLTIIIAAFCCYSRQWWGSCSGLLVGFIGLIFFVVGVGFIICVNLCYVRKFRKKWQNPALGIVLND